MSRTGYEFAGWFLDQSSSAAWDFDVQTVSESMTLLAGWVKVQYPITYQLDGGANHPENPSFYVISDDSITLLAPTRAGYQFDGWFDAETGGNPVTIITTQNLSPVTLYAHRTMVQPIPVTGESGPDTAQLLGLALLLAGIGGALRKVRNGGIRKYWNGAGHKIGSK
jgi:uncharacterized repeat protein (TIGR02543 family)/LPXTG-motif cell wall-anchored protein